MFERLFARVVPFFMDEVRYGQKGVLRRVWARRGSRPTIDRQQQFDYCYIYGAANMRSGQCVMMIAPAANTEWMNEHLRLISKSLQRGDHGVVILDQAGWHMSGDLKVPWNLTLLHQPPYSPELNGIERLWGWLKDKHLSNRSYANYAEMLEAGQECYDALTRERVLSLCRCTWLEKISA